MMRNYLCWDPGVVRQVINPFAEHIPDSLFRAVHSDWDLKVSPPVGKSFQEISEAAWSEQTPPEFLADFLREERPHALAAIVGETGSGKSHLVHWMRLNIKPDRKRLVLVVRKSGTSLRAIVKMIIDELPQEEQRSFLDTLQAAGAETQSRDDQKQQLLNDIAQVIREDAVPADGDEVEQALVQNLPHLFQDPHMRASHFLADNTVIAEIVDHIFAPSNARDRPDRRRSFAESDLPLGGLDFVHASKQARDAMKIIELDPAVFVPLSIRIINRNLDRAVARTLSFSGDRVEELMARLRSHLKAQGKELVLLVEEFARLQGIDRALLQAITSQGDEQQCKIRAAIAVTTGFLEGLAETAYMRTTHIVDMNRSAGRAEGSDVTPESLSHFASRYLNAVRLGKTAIDEWDRAARPGESAPSRCDTCPYQPECHAAFGEVDGYGLYPFTQTALWNCASRTHDSMPYRLNPRILQNDLLVEVLDNQAGTIETGTYPSFGLLAKLGGVKELPLAARAELQNRNPETFERWEAFLEIYDGTGRIANLDSRVRDAFDVPEIPGGIVGKTPTQPSEPVDPKPSRSDPLSREDRAIEDWINGSGLDQTVATQLRTLVFAAVSESIDWDMLGLAKATFSGKSPRPFQPNSISFDRQTTQVAEYVPVKLRIPGDLVKPITAGTALQGFLRASKNQFRWDFEGGDKMLGAFLDCIEVWSNAVEAQLRLSCSPSPSWDQATGALALLCTGAAIGGRIKPDAKPGEMLEAAFGPWPDECASSATEMRSLYDKLLRGREKISAMAHAQLSSMKGGRVGAMLDPRKVGRILRAIRKDKWHLVLDPPAEDNGDVAKHYREAKANLAAAAAAELASRQQWLSEMDTSFGNDASRATIISKLEAAQSAALDAGVGSNNTSRFLTTALERFRGVQFDDSIAAARQLVEFEDAISALPHFGRGRRNSVESASALVGAAAAFLDAVDENLTAFGKSHEVMHSAIESSLEQIDLALQSIESSLTFFDVSSRGSSNAP